MAAGRVLDRLVSQNGRDLMRVVSVFLILAGTLVLAGCKDTGRPLSYKKGVYGGKADTKLNTGQLEALRHRGGLQRQ